MKDPIRTPLNLRNSTVTCQLPAPRPPTSPTLPRGNLPSLPPLLPIPSLERLGMRRVDLHQKAFDLDEMKPSSLRRIRLVRRRYATLPLHRELANPLRTNVDDDDASLRRVVQQYPWSVQQRDERGRIPLARGCLPVSVPEYGTPSSNGGRDRSTSRIGQGRIPLPSLMTQKGDGVGERWRSLGSSSSCDPNR